MKKHWILFCLTFVHLVIAILGYINYPGSAVSFLFFTLSFYLCLLVAYFKKHQSSLCFLGGMLYLGFFVKICMHLFLSAAFVEPIGNFRGGSQEWSEVLNVSSIGILGYVLSVIVTFPKLNKNLISFDKSKSYNLRGNSYSYGLKLFMPILFIITIGVAILNLNLGINLSGVAAITILPWPLNAIIGWLLYVGFGLVAAHISQIEFNNGARVRWGYYYLLFEAFVSSISIISRGLFLFHTIPSLYVLFQNRTRLMRSYLNLFKHLILIVALYFVSSIAAVSSLRGYYYNYDFSSEKRVTTFVSQGVSQGKLFSLTKESQIILNNLQRIFVDRWVGAEGVMAITTYPYRNFNLLWDSMTSVPKYGTQDVYNKISGSFYAPNDHYVFTTIPGPIATLYYTGSLIFVFGGMFIFSLIIFSFEYLISFTFENAFMNCFLGFYAANSVAQFGLSPLPLIKSYTMTIFGLGLSYLVLKRFGKFSRIKTCENIGGPLFSEGHR